MNSYILEKSHLFEPDMFYVIQLPRSLQSYSGPVFGPVDQSTRSIPVYFWSVGLRLLLYQSFIRTAIVNSPAGIPRTIKIALSGTTLIIAFDEGEVSLTKWVVCDLAGLL